MDNSRHILNVISIICDPKRIQRIAITCRCGHRWTENIPGELHDSNLIARFECRKCHRELFLRNHILTSRIEGGLDERQDTTNTNNWGFDA